MNVKNLILTLVIFCYVAVASYAQDQTNNRFAYSYGLIVGDNVKKLGLDANTFPFESVMKGVKAALDSKDPKPLEKTAQIAVNTETEQLQGGAKVTYPRSGFAYNYGVLIGMNWRLFGLNMNDVPSENFKTGMVAKLNGQKVDMTVAEAQAEVTGMYQLQEEKKKEQQLLANKSYLAANAKKAGVQSLASGVQYKVLAQGNGKQVDANSQITLNYKGQLIDGTIFESSTGRGGAIDVNLNGVIRGWKEVLPMMKEGDKWEVVIPTHLGYGNRVRGNVPANSLLIYELEVVKVTQ